MATKPTGAVLIKWVGNNSPRFDERIFWQDIQSIVSVNDQDVPVLSPADLKPGDTVLVQHIGKHNKPGRRRWKAVVMDEDEVAEAQAAARLSPSSFSQDSETDAPCQRSSQKRKATSTEPGCKQPGGTKKPRNKGNVLVVGEGAGCCTDDEENLGKEPSQVLSVQASSGCPLQELSMAKEASSGCPLQELSMAKEVSSGRPLQELSMAKETSSGRPLQELSMAKKVSSGRPLQELSMTEEASSGHPLQEVSMSKEASSDRPLQELLITKDASSGRPLQQWLNQEATPWINPAQNPLLERSPSRLESQQRLTGYGNLWQDPILQAIQRIEHHQMMQQQEMLNLTTSHQQAIQRMEAKLAKQEEKQNQVLQQQEQLRQMTLQQANKQTEIHKEVAHLHNKQDQLADKQDILQSMLMKESGVFRTPPVMSPAFSLSRTPSNIRPSMPWPGFSPPQFPTPQFLTPQFPTKCPGIRASSCPPVPMVTQLSEYDDELTSILSDSYISELSGVMDDSLLSGAVESSSVVAPQETLRQSLLPSASQPSVSDTQLSALPAGGGCPPQLTNIDEHQHPRQAGGGCPPQLTNIDEHQQPGQAGGGCPPQLMNIDEHQHPRQAGGGCPPQLTNVNEPSYSGQVSGGDPLLLTNVDEPSYSRQVGGGLPPRLTNTDEPSHSGQVGDVAHNRKILKRSAAQVVQDHPELCSVANVGTLAVKLARYSFFGDDVLRASSLTGKNGAPLNETQLELLQNFICNTVVPSMPLEEFKKQLWPLCKSALSNCCKRLRANLKAKTKTKITRPREQ